MEATWTSGHLATTLARLWLHGLSSRTSSSAPKPLGWRQARCFFPDPHMGLSSCNTGHAPRLSRTNPSPAVLCSPVVSPGVKRKRKLAQNWQRLGSDELLGQKLRQGLQIQVGGGDRYKYG